jgi:PKD repeat protein
MGIVMRRVRLASLVLLAGLCFKPALVNAAASSSLGLGIVVSVNQNSLCLLSGPAANPSIAVPNQTINFSAVASENNVTWLWDFGDGTQSGAGGNVSHIYTTPNTYTVSVYATDTFNNQIMGSVSVLVIKTAITAVTGNPNPAQMPANANTVSVVFTAVTNNVNVSWLWDFGDGTQSNMGATVAHVFTPGVWAVNVKVLDLGGNTASGSVIEITGVNPTPKLIVSTADSLAPSSVSLACDTYQIVNFSVSPPGNSNWIYAFGDGTQTTGPGTGVIHYYSTAGDYTATATSTVLLDNNGNPLGLSVNVDANDCGFTQAELSALTLNPYAKMSQLPGHLRNIVVRGMAHFNISGRDTWTLQAELPNFSWKQPAGASVWGYCGGAAITVALGAKQRGKNAAGSVRLRLAEKKMPNALVQMKANAGSFAQAWDPPINPSQTIKKTALNFVVAVSVNNQPFVATVSTNYSGVKNKGGSFRSQKAKP